MLLQERYYDQLATDGEPTFESLEERHPGKRRREETQRGHYRLRGFIKRFESGDLVDRDWPRIWKHFKGGTWLKMGGMLVSSKRLT